MSSRSRNLSCAAVMLGLACQVHAATSDTALNFSAQQSLWGSGPSAAFGSTWQFDLGPVGFGYDVGASTGTVAASLGGRLAVDYSASMGMPGLANLSLDFIGTPGGGSLTSDLGAWIEVWGKVVAVVPIIDQKYSLNVDQSFTPTLGGTVQGSDALPLAGTGLDLGVAKVGADFNIDQTDTFAALALNGTLDYSLRGSGITQSLPFSIASSNGLDLSVPLSQTGDWDFAVRDLSLSNRFSTSFGASLVLYEQHIDGIDWCHSWIFYYPCGFSYDRNAVTLASLDLYDAQPFALDFNSIAAGPKFSVAVVPEPATLPLLALGLAVLGASRLHRATIERRTRA